MKKRIHEVLSINVAIAILICMLSGCGSSGDGGPSLQDIPRYPNATKGESIQHSGPGPLGGKLQQFSTTDSYDQVVEFYTDELKKYDPEFTSHTSDLGRQTAISIPQKNGVISVAIQEFTKEGKVGITFMQVGS